MKQVAIHEFKAHLSAFLEMVLNKFEPIILTKHGKPIVKIIPLPPPAKPGDNPLKGSVLYYGDIESPIEVEWEAIRE